LLIDGCGTYPIFLFYERIKTAKVRIVYDSAARYGGVRLNDTMLPGPKLQQDVFDVLLRFRSNLLPW